MNILFFKHMQFWVKSTFIPVDISCQSHIVYKSYIMTGRDCINAIFKMTFCTNVHYNLKTTRLVHVTINSSTTEHIA